MILSRRKKTPPNNQHLLPNLKKIAKKNKNNPSPLNEDSNHSNDNNQPLNNNNQEKNNDKNRERERAERTNDNEFLSKDQREQNQQQKSQLQQAITDLESKPNKTPQEEADLIKKRKDLEKLNNQNSEPANDKNNWLKPVLIIGGTALVIGLIIYLLKRNSKR